jgi:CO dehydrogenase/acetyl-CoA synthase gamma subunit (corrinoid Fe-S protein)
VSEKTEIEGCVIVTEVVSQIEEIVKLENMNKTVKEIVIETGIEIGREEMTTEIDQVRKIRSALRRTENQTSRTIHHLKMCK